MKQLIKFHFYVKGKTLISKGIEHVTGGEFSHVSIELFGKVYEAIGGRLYGTNGVVMSTDKEAYHKGRYKSTRIETVEVEADYNKAKDLEKELELNRVGDEYDYSGVVSFFIRFIPGKEDKNYCSELGVFCFKYIGGVVSQERVSPVALYDIIINYRNDGQTNS